MSRRRRRQEPLWVRIAAFAVAIIVALLLVTLVIRGLLGAIGLTRSRGAGGGDPQFAEPAEAVTRPPELDEQGNPIGDGDDPSALWEQGEQTPVDKTAGELALEEQSAN